jgi:hypothetical protein
MIDNKLSQRSNYDKMGNFFPVQRKSYHDKVKNDFEWCKRCIDAGIWLSRGTETQSRRSHWSKKERNYNLYNGKFDKDDMGYELSPLSMEGYTFPAKLQYRDIASPIFNLLIGEEAKRGTQFTVLSSSPEVTSQREEKKKAAILNLLSEYFISENPESPPEEAIKKTQDYFTYDYKDIQSQTAQHLLNYLYKNLKLDYHFYKAWEDVLIAGEEVFEIAELGNEPSVRRINPLHFYCVLNKDSDFIDDAEIIIHDTYMSPGQIIDDYYDELSPEEIDEIESLIDNRLPLDSSFSLFPPKDVIGVEGESYKGYTNYTDEFGNVRVSKVTWKSRKKIGKVTYIDENQEIQSVLVDEHYKENKSNAQETIEWFWINEYWEGIRVKNNIYLNMGPKKQQFRKMDNLSYCRSGYVGTLYNANNSTSVSLMDRLVPWIYLYITVWYRTELLMAANQGKIALIDVSLIPNGWEPEKWMYYASIMKFGFVDSFNEGMKGQSKGKLAGNMSQQQNKSLDLETGNAIQHHISILEYIESKVHELAGVTKPRKGEIKASEGVGNVQTSVSQSYTITEKWFELHNSTKQRVLEVLLHVARDVYRDNPQKLQYITNDLGIISFNIDNEFVETEYNLFVSDSVRDQQELQALKQLSESVIQQEKGDIYEVAQIFHSKSMGELLPKLKQHSIEKKSAEQRMQEIQQSIEQAKLELEQQKREDENFNKEADRQTKIRVAEIQALSLEQDTGEGAKQITEAAKLAMKEREISSKEKQNAEQNSQDRKAQELKEKELNLKRELKEKEIASRERIAKTKAKQKPKKS